MSYVIAVAGKGGVGKTTTAALIVRFLLKTGRKPILAVDADPNSNFAESIGIAVNDTVGGILSDFLKTRGSVPQGMTKQSWLDMKLHQVVKEEKDIDMLVMGCPEGPGCYCAANSMLKSYFDSLMGNYPFIIIDNEAGMEHFSRKTESDIDLLLLCSNYSLKGIKTAERISKLIDDLGLQVKKRYLLINNTPDKIDDDYAAEIRNTGLPYAGSVASDKMIEEHELKGSPITDLPDTSAAVQCIDKILSKIIIP
ncbi:MAG: AAA family ATPase [Spirochaetes bacterium]|nr:AAA family ATPase [Spirochaetota bacterium]